ncbi:MFS general substrate transporter [Rostrohypoxylon terebratum]|nr:MFS general substrate transporter [Rostrohypoxylon terebratum]
MAAVTVSPGWFTTHRGLTLGIILARTGVGGLVWAPVTKATIDALGFRNALRVSGVISFVMVSLSSEKMAWEPQSLARINAENASRAGHLGGILQVPLKDCAATTICVGVPSTVYGATDNSRGLFISFVVFYGLFVSAYTRCFRLVSSRSLECRIFASVNGVLYMIRGVATLVGTPVAVALIQSGWGSSVLPHGYVNMSVLVSVILSATSVALLWIQIEAMVGLIGRVSLKWRM